jgi:hypothetical protein
MKKSNIKDDATLNKYYSEARKIRFKDDEPVETIGDIILRLWYKNEATVYKKGSLHVPTNKYRSINDYLLLCKYYFPKMDVKEAMDKLVEHQKRFNDARIKKVFFRYCPDIKMTNSGGLTTGTAYSYNKMIYSMTNNINLGVRLVMENKTWKFKSN